MSPSLESVAAATVVFQARGLTKTYRMGDVEVHALRGVDVDL
jgi:putative ABC transport system ATP-binding protein